MSSGHHPKVFFQQMWDAIAMGKVWHGEIKNRAKDGSIFWLDTTVVPFVGSEGKPRQYAAIRADITELKQAESRLGTHGAVGSRQQRTGGLQLLGVARSAGAVAAHRRLFEDAGRGIRPNP